VAAARAMVQTALCPEAVVTDRRMATCPAAARLKAADQRAAERTSLGRMPVSPACARLELAAMACPAGQPELQRRQIIC